MSVSRVGKQACSTERDNPGLDRELHAFGNATSGVITHKSSIFKILSGWQL